MRHDPGAEWGKAGASSPSRLWAPNAKRRGSGRAGDRKRASNVFAKFFRDDKADTIFGPTFAGMFPIIFEIIPIVVGEFLSGSDGSFGNHPKAPGDALDDTVRGAAMIGESGRVPVDAPI